VSQAHDRSPSGIRPEAHAAQALAAVVCASLAFAASMAALGVTRQIDDLMATAFASIRPEGGFVEPSPALVWAGTGLAAIVVTFVLLHTPTQWRRVVFLAASLAVTCAWAPVLALAALRPAIAIPALAVIAAGAGSWLYTARHHMPSDATHETC
jgi:hypothetical protein